MNALKTTPCKGQEKQKVPKCAAYHAVAPNERQVKLRDGEAMRKLGAQ